MARAATALFFSGKLPRGVAVNKINIHKFYCHTFPPMCVAPGRAANFYSNPPINSYHRFVSERGLGPCVCDGTARECFIDCLWSLFVTGRLERVSLVAYGVCFCYV
jgi:hypothetical protein